MQELKEALLTVFIFCLVVVILIICWSVANPISGVMITIAFIMSICGALFVILAAIIQYKLNKKERDTFRCTKDD